MQIFQTGLTAALFTGLSTAAMAVPLAPGGVVFTTGTSAAANPNLAAGIVNDGLIPFVHDPTPVTPFSNVGGNIQDRVTLSNTLNTLIFAPRIRDTFNIDGGTLAIHAISVDGYAGVDVDVDFRTDGQGDIGSSSVSRSADGDLMTIRYDDLILVDSLNPLGRQEESLFMSILTDATDHDASGTMTIFAEIIPANTGSPSGIPGNLFSFTVAGISAPLQAVPAVPVPASMALFGTGLFAFGAMRRAKRKS